MFFCTDGSPWDGFALGGSPKVLVESSAVATAKADRLALIRFIRFFLLVSLKYSFQLPCSLPTIVSAPPDSGQADQKENTHRYAEPSHDIDRARGFGCIPYASRPGSSVLRTERSPQDATRTHKPERNRNRCREEADLQCLHDYLLTLMNNTYGISPTGVALYPAVLTTSITRSGGTGLPGS